MSKVNWFRVLSTSLIFALVGGLSPEFIRWGLLGYTLMLIAIKIEEGHNNDRKNIGISVDRKMTVRGRA